LFFSTLRPPPSTTLFPYTTLFRSPPQLRCERFSSIHLPYIRHMFYNSYWTSTSFAVLSTYVASYMISVRQTGGLPRISFRFHVTMDTLIFGYVLTAIRSH